MITKPYSYCTRNTDASCLAITSLKLNHTARKRTLFLRLHLGWIPTAAPLPLSFPWLLLLSRLICFPNLLSQGCRLPLPLFFFILPHRRKEEEVEGLKTHSFFSFSFAGSFANQSSVQMLPCQRGLHLPTGVAILPPALFITLLHSLIGHLTNAGH